MQKLIIYILVFAAFNRIQAQQKDSSVFYYDLGVKAFSNRNYILADSLFSKSIAKFGHPDTYFNRAACRQKTGNTKGYCDDLCSAAILGDKEARALFLKECGSLDTTYTDANNKPTDKKDQAFQLITYRNKHDNNNGVVLRYDKDGSFISSYRVQAGKTAGPDMFMPVEEMTEFPGGISAMLKYMRSNLTYPAELREKGLSGRVFTKFVVNETGEISNIEITKGIDGCESCNAEAIRLIKKMPFWKPAKMGGKVVKSYYNLPISFKMQ